MNKIVLAIILAFAFHESIKAQVKLDDFGRIVLNTYLSDKLDIPAEAKEALSNKLDQITTSNGIVGSAANARFIITASVNKGTKDIIAGPPQMTSYNLEVTLFIGDAVDNKKFTSMVLNIKGVGTNENKAFIDAFKNINTKNKAIVDFLEEGKSKIVSYYASQCDLIIKQANTLAEQYKFEEAIFTLMSVPETCKDCYFKSKEETSLLFNKKIESDCTEKLKQAKLIWAAEPTENGALKASAIMISIIPSDNCKTEINKLSEEIKKKLQTDQQKKYDFEMLEMQKQYDNEQKQLDAYKVIALEQAKNQAKTVTYNNIYWR
jgi:hypothetical protein